MEYLLIAKNPAFEIPAPFNVSSSEEQLVLHENLQQDRIILFGTRQFRFVAKHGKLVY